MHTRLNIELSPVFVAIGPLVGYDSVWGDWKSEPCSFCTCHHFMIQLSILKNLQQCILHTLQSFFDLADIFPMLCQSHTACLRHWVAFLNGCSPLISIQQLTEMMPHIWPKQQLPNVLLRIMTYTSSNRCGSWVL